MSPAEPLAADSPLRALDNVVLSPHAAGYSIEAMADLRYDMGNTAAEWIRNGWQRFRIVTVLDRLTGAIRSDDGSLSYTGKCAVADPAKRIF